MLLKLVNLLACRLYKMPGDGNSLIVPDCQTTMQIWIRACAILKYPEIRLRSPQIWPVPRD